MDNHSFDNRTPATEQPPVILCPRCGNPTAPGAAACPVCGQPTGTASAAQPAAAAPPVTSAAPAAPATPTAERPATATGNHTDGSRIFSTVAPVVGLVVIVVGIIWILVAAIMPPDSSPTYQSPGQTTARPAVSSTQTVGKSSLVVSNGVNPDDLGNIGIGQFYFISDEAVFYTSFDMDARAHIYRQDPASGETRPILNGFGWSLVAYDDYLYFTGNLGSTIDGSYKLCRIRSDGGELQVLSEARCSTLNIYGDWLYYVREAADSDGYRLCRAELDGEDEQVLLELPGSNYAIYRDALYFVDSSGRLCRADLDGDDDVALLDDVSFFIIANRRLLYLDHQGDIRSASLDGSVNKLLLSAGDWPVNNIGSAGNTIYYTLMDPQQDAELNAHAYELYSMTIDGKEPRLLYASHSFGTFFNVVNGRILVMDYSRDLVSGSMQAVTRDISADGLDVQDLDR